MRKYYLFYILIFIVNIFFIVNCKKEVTAPDVSVNEVGLVNDLSTGTVIWGIINSGVSSSVYKGENDTFPYSSKGYSVFVYEGTKDKILYPKGGQTIWVKGSPSNWTVSIKN